MVGTVPGPAGSTKIGDRFFRLVAVERIGPDARGGNLKWRFRCDCGNLTDAIVAHVRNGHKKSCGCWAKEKRTEIGGRQTLDHGAARRGAITPEYIIWQGAISRCEDENHSSYKNYGGRGIRVREPFRSSFAAFLAEVGPRPSRAHSIDRINNDGDYAPGNVRWATKAEQMANRRVTRCEARP